MFAARLRTSLHPLLHRTYSSYSSRNYEIAAISMRILHDRFSDGERTLTSLRLSGNGVGTKLFYRSFLGSPRCYSSKSDVGVKTHTAALFSSLEDDLFSELGSVEKDKNQNKVLKPSQKAKGRKQKRKHEQASDSILKPKLLTEKPESSWKTNGKRKVEAHASSAARNVTDSNVSFSKSSKSSYPIQDCEFIAQNITSSKGSSTSNAHPSSAVIIRIGNLHLKTTDSMIHLKCLSIGHLKGLARVNVDTVDVVFQPRNLNEADSLLEKLNGATVDDSEWTTEIIPEAKEACKDKIGIRITSYFEDLEKQLKMRRIIVKDMEVLVHSVKHLENHPAKPLI